MWILLLIISGNNARKKFSSYLLIISFIGIKEKYLCGILGRFCLKDEIEIYNIWSFSDILVLEIIEIICEKTNLWHMCFSILIVSLLLVFLCIDHRIHVWTLHDSVQTNEWLVRGQCTLMAPNTPVNGRGELHNLDDFQETSLHIILVYSKP